MLAAPAGLAAGAALWLIAGGGDGRALAATQASLRALPRARTSVSGAGTAALAANALLASPLFNRTEEPAHEVALRLEGIARTPGRVAALVSADGASAQWVSVGEVVGGATLQSLSGAGAVFDTPNGVREIALGSTTGPPAPSAPPTGLPGTSMAQGFASGPPPGFRGPPPPASAPRPVP